MKLNKSRALGLERVIILVLLVILVYTWLADGLQPNEKEVKHRALKRKEVFEIDTRSRPAVVTRDLDFRVQIMGGEDSTDEKMYFDGYRIGHGSICSTIDFSKDAFVANKVPMKLLGNSFFTNIITRGYGVPYENFLATPCSSPIIKGGFISSFWTVSKYEIKDTEYSCMPLLTTVEVEPYYREFKSRYPVESIGRLIPEEYRGWKVFSFSDWNHTKEFEYAMLPVKKGWNERLRIDNKIQLYYIVDLNRVSAEDYWD